MSGESYRSWCPQCGPKVFVKERSKRLPRDEKGWFVSGPMLPGVVMTDSIDIVLTCPVHGPDEKPFEVAGTKFCAKCVRDFLANGQKGRPISVLEMMQTKRNRGVSAQSGTKTRCSCGHSWYEGGTSCPKCGKDDHVDGSEGEGA